MSRILGLLLSLTFLSALMSAASIARCCARRSSCTACSSSDRKLPRRSGVAPVGVMHHHTQARRVLVHLIKPLLDERILADDEGRLARLALAHTHGLVRAWMGKDERDAHHRLAHANLVAQPATATTASHHGFHLV